MQSWGDDVVTKGTRGSKQSMDKGEIILGRFSSIILPYCKGIWGRAEERDIGKAGVCVESDRHLKIGLEP